MKRIRYVKQPDGSMVSMQIIQTHNGEVRSVIFPNGTSGMLVDASSGKPVSDILATTSSHKIKIKLKSKLSLLGVVFDDESRSVNEINKSTVE